MTSLGLASFLAMVGLQAAREFLPALQAVGLLLSLGAIMVCLAPLWPAPSSAAGHCE